MSKRSRIARRRQLAWRAYMARLAAIFRAEMVRSLELAVEQHILNGGRGL